MKKKILVLFIILLFTACTLPTSTKKINNSYYSKQVIEKMKTGIVSKGSVLDFRLYQEITFSTSEIETIKNFMFNLKPNNYIAKPNNFSATPQYRIFVYVGADKYVIDIYDEKHITLFPWDGTYKKDYIDMSNTYLSYNLFSLCKNALPDTK